MQSVKLNLIPGAVLPVVNVSQYDIKRTFQLAIYDGAASYDLTGKTVTIRGTKPDNHGFDYGTSDGVVSVSGNTVTISTTQQMTAVGGQVMAELRIESGTTVIGTLNFIIDVEPSALSDDTIISETEIPVIERDFEAALAEAEADALVAEGYAKGTQGGVPVGSGSPYYHNNAEHFKDEAEAAASGVLEKYPKIVSDYWYVWDVDTSQYVNTGVRAKGTQGDPGEGVPAGGTTGQVLRKKSDDNYDTEWANGGGGASALDDLTDVDITSATSGDGLLYDGSKWANGAVATPTQLAAKLDVTAQQQLGAWNLFQNNGISGTWNGATFTKNADDTVTVDIAGSAVTVDINYLMSNANYLALPHWLQPGTTAYISGCDGGNYSVFDGGSDTFYIYCAFQNSNHSFISATASSKGERQFTVPANAAYYRIGMIITPAAGKLTNKVFSPMIALQSGMPYVPWVMTNEELTDAVTVKTATVQFGTNISNNSTAPLIVNKVGGMVFMNGRIDASESIAGVSYPLFTLPAEFIPKATKYLIAIYYNYNGAQEFGQVNVNSNGKVYTYVGGQTATGGIVICGSYEV